MECARYKNLIYTARSRDDSTAIPWRDDSDFTTGLYVVELLQHLFYIITGFRYFIVHPT